MIYIYLTELTLATICAILLVRGIDKNKDLNAENCGWMDNS